MTAKAVLCRALLEGRVLTVMNCFREVGLTNIAREIPRLVERPFKVMVSRTSKDGKNRYKQKVSYTEYRLNQTEYNTLGMEKMWEYVLENWGDNPPKRPVGRPKDDDVPPTSPKVQTLF